MTNVHSADSTGRASERRRDPEYTGLPTAVPSLPSDWYYNAEHYKVELEKIWYRHWLYVALSAQVASPRSYLVYELGDQSIVLVRGEDGGLRGFHNTCRHRGSNLCRAPSGVLPRAGIICPYHAWRYDLQGRLFRTSSKLLADDFDPRQHDLYPVAVHEWNGCVFICLTDPPPTFGATFDQPLNRFDDWRIAELALGPTVSKVVGCNWKTFWENYNECLHCPGVHPQLSKLVPIFGRGLQERRDDPAWLDHADDQDSRFSGRIRAGAASWTSDGGLAGRQLPGLSEADRAAGATYVTCLPGAFIVGHVDYVRIVRMRPLGPEQTELSAQFLFLPETLTDPNCDINKAVEFSQLVMQEDAQVSELSQRGLHARPHRHGTLMPEEYLLARFQEWVRAQL